MKTDVKTYGIRLATRHPGHALRLGVAANSAMPRRVRVAAARHEALRLAAPAQRAATDPRVRAEARRATRSAYRATRRARRVGPANALTDKGVARDLRRASRHASRAAELAMRPPRHRGRKTAVVLLGAGAVLAAAYGGRRVQSGS
jgi:hypothetical protein